MKLTVSQYMAVIVFSTMSGFIAGLTFGKPGWGNMAALLVAVALLMWCFIFGASREEP